MANTRTRNGCLTCRSRKRKCDNTHPKCGGCEARKLTCRWGLKVSFHPSRQLELTDRECEHLAHVETRHQQSSSARFVDSTKHIYRYFRDSEVTDDDLLLSLEAVNSGSDSAECCTTTDTLSAYTLTDARTLPDHPRPFTRTGITLLQDLQTGRREHDHAVDVESRRCESATGPEGDNAPLPDARDATSDLSENDMNSSHVESDAQGILPVDTFAAPTLDGSLNNADGTYYDLPFSLGLALSDGVEHVTAINPWTEPEYPLNEGETVDLLQSFITYSATWCETTDTDKNFSVVFVHDIVAHKICMAAALALACRHRSVFDQSYNETALKLYQYTVQLLIRQDPDHTDPFVLTACILLCVYEMISADVADWRRHLKGCAGLFVTHGWNGSSTGLTKACFWAFARIDIWASFVSGMETLIPTPQWVHDDSLEVAASIEIPDDYCNLAIVAFARTINCVSKIRQNVAAAQAYDEMKRLSGYLRRWWDLRPKRVHHLMRSPKSAENTFPRTIFTSPTAVCGNIFYHCSAILLLRVLRSQHRPEPSFHQPHNDPIFHAREIGGISMSNRNHANWVNHLQPLYVAGQVFAENTAFPLEHDVRLDERGGFRANQARRGQIATQSESLKYAEEKFTLLKHLQVIQSETGWKTDDRARELRHLWGLQ